MCPHPARRAGLSAGRTRTGANTLNHLNVRPGPVYTHHLPLIRPPNVLGHTLKLVYTVPSSRDMAHRASHTHTNYSDHSDQRVRQKHNPICCNITRQDGHTQAQTDKEHAHLNPGQWLSNTTTCSTHKQTHQHATTARHTTQRHMQRGNLGLERSLPRHALEYACAALSKAPRALRAVRAAHATQVRERLMGKGLPACGWAKARVAAQAGSAGQDKGAQAKGTCARLRHVVADCRRGRGPPRHIGALAPGRRSAIIATLQHSTRHR